MAFNLIDEVKNYITPDVISKASSMLGENSGDIQKAVSGALPTIVGGLVGKAGQSDGISSIMSMLGGGNFDGSLLENVSGLFSTGTQSNSLMSAGSSVLSGLFGDKVNGVTSAISSFSGIKSSSASSLLGMLASLVMSSLASKVKTDGLNASGLSSLLSSQKSLVSDTMPSGLSSILGSVGLGSLTNIAGAAKSAVSGAAGEVKSQSNRWLPLLLLLVAIGAIVYFWKSCNSKSSMTMTTMDTTKKMVDTMMNSYPSATAPDTMKSMASGMTMRKLADGTSISIKTNGFEDQLVTFIEDGGKPVDKTTWFTTDGITFETGSATLKPESDVQIQNIVTILKAYPKVNLKIGGYTDNTGDEKANMKLSSDRANATMNAIVAKGADAKRLSAEGYGSKFPLATNSTDEGRAKNRRIDVRVTQK